MLRNKIFFSRALNKVSYLALSGVLLATLLSSASWAMDKEKKEYQVVTARPNPLSEIDKLKSNNFQQIFFYLTPEQLGKAALVSKMFYYESVKDACWKPFGVTSKKNYAFYKKNPLITIYNDGPTVQYEIGIAYGIGKYFATTDSKMKGQSFNLHIMNIELKENEETKIRVLGLPKHIKILEPKEIYGVTFPTQAKLDLFSPSIDVDFGKCLEEMQQQDMNKIPLFILESMECKSKFKLEELKGEIGIVGTRCLKEYK